MDWLTGGWVHLGAVAGKAVLMYATALLALRVGERRTLAQWTIIDFATAVAMGAIIGRTAVAGTQSYVTGAAAVVTLVAVHRFVSALRFTRPVGKLVDHRVRVLVAHGRIRDKELRRCGLTGDDFAAHLRQRGVFSVEGLRYVLYEAKGDLTIVPEADGDGRPSRSDGDLVAAGLENAAGYP